MTEIKQRRIRIPPREPGGEWFELDIDASWPSPTDDRERRRLGKPAAPPLLPPERTEAIRRGSSVDIEHLAPGQQLSLNNCLLAMQVVMTRALVSESFDQQRAALATVTELRSRYLTPIEEQTAPADEWDVMLSLCRAELRQLIDLGALLGTMGDA